MQITHIEEKNCSDKYLAKKPYSPPKNIAIQSIQVSKWSKKYFNLYALILKAPGKIIVYSPATKRNCR